MNPNFRTLYKKLSDAPEPKADGFYIAVEIENGWCQDYVSKDGEYVVDSAPYYPAKLD